MPPVARHRRQSRPLSSCCFTPCHSPHPHTRRQLADALPPQHRHHCPRSVAPQRRQRQQPRCQRGRRGQRPGSAGQRPAVGHGARGGRLPVTRSTAAACCAHARPAWPLGGTQPLSPSLTSCLSRRCRPLAAAPPISAAASSPLPVCLASCVHDLSPAPLTCRFGSAAWLSCRLPVVNAHSSLIMHPARGAAGGCCSSWRPASCRAANVGARCTYASRTASSLGRGGRPQKPKKRQLDLC